MNRAPAALLLLVACSAPEAPKPEDEVCAAGVARAALDAVDRKIMGAAAPYPADGTLRVAETELATSQAERRRVAWATVEKVLTTVPLAETPPSLGDVPAAIPTWQTWYGFDDLRRIFHRLYEDLSPEERASRTPFSDEALDDAFLWNVGAVHELPNWPEDRYIEYLEAIDSATDVAGLGGLSRVGYSPAAARHLLASYPQVLACRDDGVPPAIADGPVEEIEIARQPVDAASCETKAIGSYAVGPGETLRALIEDGAGAKLDLSSADATCTSEAGEWCEIRGPAVVDVAATAGVDPLRSVVAIHRAAARPEWAGCLAGPFPTDGAIIKADYRRADLEIKLPSFSTSADAMKARLGGDVSWTIADGEADPGPDDIYTLTLPSGPKYRLAALHIMTKELDHWLWITLWWSETPNEDFGADRPESIASLGGPWKSYKMCVTTAFNEEDPLPGGGFDETHPSLAAALTAVYAGKGAPTWCSNPYLEEGHGNAATNCIGCHQHGGTELRPEDILLLSDFGRPARRNNFPADYSWATTRGDDLGQLFADEEAWWMAAR